VRFRNGLARARFASPAASGAPGEECAVSPRRTVGALEKGLVFDARAAAQGGQDEVVRKILDLVGNAAMAPGHLDERRAYFSQGRHLRTTLPSGNGTI
jgi:hypothetical protein